MSEEIINSEQFKELTIKCPDCGSFISKGAIANGYKHKCDRYRDERIAILEKERYELLKRVSELEESVNQYEEEMEGLAEYAVHRDDCSYDNTQEPEKCNCGLNKYLFMLDESKVSEISN